MEEAFAQCCGGKEEFSTIRLESVLSGTASLEHAVSETAGWCCHHPEQVVDLLERSVSAREDKGVDLVLCSRHICVSDQPSSFMQARCRILSPRSLRILGVFV